MIFLNEVFMAGRDAQHGSKAVLRIESEGAPEFPTLRERLGLLCASIRSASVSGLPPKSILHIMSAYIWDELAQGDTYATASWQPCGASHPQKSVGSRCLP